MARAVQRRANKDYPDHGIKKGDQYWFAEVMLGPRSSRTIRSKNPIPRSQLTASEFLSTAYDLSDRLEHCDDVSDLEEIKSEFETLRDDTSGKLDNMPDGLREGQTGQDMQERVDQCDSLIEEIDSAISAAQECESEEDWEELDDEAKAERVRDAIPEFSNLF